MSTKRPLISKEITIRDVAEEAGVSISLVSFVLNAKRGPNGEYLCSASPKTAQRIVDAAERLGYHRNKAASALRTGNSETIGVIVSDITNACFGDVCRKIENLSSEAGLLAIFGSTDDRFEKFNQLVSKFLDFGVEGVIAAACPGMEESIMRFLNHNVPVVLFDRDLDLDNVGRVILDNNKSGRIAARHLLDLGKEDIWLIRYETDIRTMLEKEDGARLEIAEAGGEMRSGIVSRDTMQKDIASVIREAIRQGADAFIFPSNTISLAGITALNKMKVRIPEDISVVAFDQANRCGIFNPGISFVEQPTNLVAEYSFKMLISAIRDSKPFSKIIVDPLFIPGDE